MARIAFYQPLGEREPLAQPVLNGQEAVSAFLNARGIWSDTWQAGFALAQDADQETCLQAYEAALKPFMQQHGYQTADVVTINPNTPNLSELRAKFLKEHTHTEDEVRFFIEGEGFFWFHLEESIFCVHCVAGDLLAVPAGVKHWFDMGEPPSVRVIRIFTDASGWTPHYTESGVEGQFALC